MVRKHQPIKKMDRKQPRNQDRLNAASAGLDRLALERSGEGSQSALAALKHIDSDRARSRPADDEGSSEG